MSNRDSLGYGDLLPQDVVDIFAQEKLSKKGRKQRSRSLGRALGWLKGKKSKKVADKGQNSGLGPAFDLALDGRPAGYQGAPKGAQKSGKQSHQQGNSHAVPKRDDTDEKTPAPIVLQENVFIEVNRPKYLEDLHSEALEGLKLMQQEERIIGPEYPDNESTISTVSVRVEMDGGGFTTDSTLPDTSSTVSMQSSVSSRSSRSGLTRQGSTFRPLNSGKKPDKGRTRRRHRKTIGSIPQHLQREFGLDRAEWTVCPQLEELVNGDGDVPQLAVLSPSENNNTEAGHLLSSVQEEQLSAAQTGHVDDMALLQRLGPAPGGGDRPWSLAVPGMTTAGSGQPGPPSPVMSMSPQAAYLSKIIPNAVLPPSIEVVEISRGSSRNSVRTVSKSSLVLSSPTSSRASSRASTARSTSSRSSTITSASRHNHFHLSDSSCWSNSDSDTLVSDSSTISSSSTPRQRNAQDKAVSKKQNKVSAHPEAPKYPSNGKMNKGTESKKDGPFVRSLSVMKPKRAPPPPSRSYSLHNKMKRRSRDLADVKIIPSQTSEGSMKQIDSPGYNADTSSLDEFSGSKTPSPPKSQPNLDSTDNSVTTDASNAKKEALQANNSSKVISPSSGYSSQDATSPKNQSPKHKKGLLAKLHKLFPTAINADSSTSAATQPESSKTSSDPVSTATDQPSVKALRELFTIPPHPKVHAPPPPPPEVWSHSPRSIELLLGPPAPGNTYAIVRKNPKDKRPYRQPASTSTESTLRSEERKQSNCITVESKKVHASQEGSLASRTNDSERLIQKNIDVKEPVKVEVQVNSLLVRTVDGNADRLPVIAEEQKTSTHNTNNPSISLVHISPRLPTKHAGKGPNVVSPESSWPPPPPPVSQAALGSPDETDLPLPPPPVFTETEIVLPVKVSSDNPNPAASSVSTSLQGNKAPPLNIPPPPPYTAPPPPIKTFAISEKVKPFSPQLKDVPPPPSKITSSPPKEVIKSPKISKPSPQVPSPKEISLAVIETPSPTPVPSTNESQAQTPVAMSLQPETSPPPQKLLVDIIPTKIITKPTLLLSNSDVPPPPDIIPPTPPIVVVAVPSIVADIPIPPPAQVSTLLHKEVPPFAEEVTSEQKEASSSQLVVTNLNCSPESEMITEVSVPSSKDIPPPTQIVLKPLPDDVAPPDTLEVLSPPVATETPPPPAAELAQPVKVILTSPEISNPPRKEISTPPQIEVTQCPLEITTSPAVSIPQQDKPSVECLKPQEVPAQSEISVPPIKDISSQPPEEVQLETSPPKEVSSPSPKDVSPPTTSSSSPLPLEVTQTPPEEIPTSPKEASSPEIVVVETTKPHMTEDSLQSGEEERFLPVVIEVSYPELSEETSTDALEEVLEDSQEISEKKEISPAEGGLNITSPDSDSCQKSEPAPQTEIKEEILNETNESLPPWKSILAPPQSIPPPPPTEQPTSDTLPSNETNKLEEIPSQSELDEVQTQPKDPAPTDSTAPPAAVDVIVVPSSPIEEVPIQEPASETAEQESDEPPSSPVTESASQNANPSNDQAVNGTPESSKTEDDPKPKENEETVSQAQIQISATTEAPQKPIRRSLVISSPPSPPATVTTQPTLFKAPSPNATVPTTTITKSPPAIAPSMNLQEAIRLRTAARSHNGPSSRLGIHSPPGFDVRKSPTSTASFIFSKSNKKVVIETRSEAKVEKRTEGPLTKVSAEQTAKKEFKVPPPVAKKPKTKTKEVEGGDKEQTAGQETQSDTIKDSTKKPNGTTRTVEGH